MERLVLKMRWEESMRWAIDLDLSKGKIGFSIKCLANLVIKDSLDLDGNIYECSRFLQKLGRAVVCKSEVASHFRKYCFPKSRFYLVYQTHIYYIFGFKRHFLHLERANKWAHYCLNNSFHWLYIFTTFFHPHVFPQYLNDVITRISTILKWRY